jgi:hypothetical protein
MLSSLKKKRREGKGKKKDGESTTAERGKEEMGRWERKERNEREVDTHF